MSTWKSVRDGAPDNPVEEHPPVSADADVPAPQVAITSLEIDQEPDEGGDPYNRTGQFCVPVFDKRNTD